MEGRREGRKEKAGEEDQVGEGWLEGGWWRVAVSVLPGWWGSGRLRHLLLQGLSLPPYTPYPLSTLKQGSGTPPAPPDAQELVGPREGEAKTLYHSFPRV